MSAGRKGKTARRAELAKHAEHVERVERVEQPLVPPYHPLPLPPTHLIFGGGIELAPSWDEVPKEFQELRSPWCKVAEEWFFRGGELRSPTKPQVDRRLALRHVQALLCSFWPRQDQKMAIAGFLLACWFEEPIAWRSGESCRSI